MIEYRSVLEGFKEKVRTMELFQENDGSILSTLPGKVRVLVDAQYAALAIMDEAGKITNFHVSGMEESDVSKISSHPTGLGLLGALHKSNSSIRVANIFDHPQSVGFPDGHPVMTSFLGVPIRRNGRSYGNLYLTNKLTAKEFTKHDQKIVEVMAEYVALSIENERMYVNETLLVEQVKHQANRLETLIENVDVGIILSDINDDVIISNKMTATIFGERLQAGNKITTCLEEYRWLRNDGTLLWDGQSPLEIKKVAPNSYDESETEITVHHKTLGKALSLSVIPIDQDGASTNLTVIRDVTKIQENETVKSEFLSMVTHDLRGPLATIQNLTKSLGIIKSGNELKSVRISLEEETENMAELVGNLLHMARVESGSIPYDPEICHILDLVNECNNQFERSRFGKSHKLHIHVASSLPSFYADHSLVLRLLNNLVSNAAKYSPTERSIWIKAHKLPFVENRVQVEIIDRGIGIPTHEQKKIFDKFYRLSNSASRVGAGLGLAICKHIVDLHQGNISVSSISGKGSSFKFDLSTV